MLNKKEMKELFEVHDAVYHGPCCSSRDVMRERILLLRATEKQLRKVAAIFECDHFNDEEVY